ncbi:molybdenum cofactor guanylyltransferase [Cerasicoccus frondis]|uniref:molybdenum cofactor guanylyltransferase n=1 Tax=Cerasicoccus frondis TaxID=490090 RepID=UPI00285291A2|nr:molybdenum cofactor guanylyltransferase [Cerasicoccus frondis]
MPELPEHSPTLGLVLAGGQSRRMGRDKSSLHWGGQALWRKQAELLRFVGLEVAVSIRPNQVLTEENGISVKHIEDCFADAGPLSGWLSAWRQYPDHALLVVACDLPLLDSGTLLELIAQRAAGHLATAYRSASDGLPEPMCALYEPAAKPVFEAALAADRRCPRKLLIEGQGRVKLLDLANRLALENANTPEEFARLEKLAGTEALQ